MTLQEMYNEIGGDYDRAIRVLRVEKLMDKHIRRLPANGIAERLIAAWQNRDATELFESAHAMKGNCANLGLVRLSELASDIAEEFRPGRVRSLSDDALDAKIREIEALHRRTVEGIKRYENS